MIYRFIYDVCLVIIRDKVLWLAGRLRVFMHLRKVRAPKGNVPDNVRVGQPIEGSQRKILPIIEIMGEGEMVW